jgi:hypothetical protein
VPPLTCRRLAFIEDETVDGPIFGMARQSDSNYVICGQFQKVYTRANPPVARKHRPLVRPEDPGHLL